MKKYIALCVAALLLVGLYVFGYEVGLHNQCTNVDLYSDYTFKCDGRVIQGPNYTKQYVTHEWTYHSSVDK